MVHIADLCQSQDYVCEYCDHSMVRHRHRDYFPTPPNAATKDHLEPRVYGGETTEENLVAACHQCNSLKGDMEAEAFRNLIQKWFRRDFSLWLRWHRLSNEEFIHLKHKCLETHTRQLAGLAQVYIEFAFRYDHFRLRIQRRTRV